MRILILVNAAIISLLLSGTGSVYGIELSAKGQLVTEGGAPIENYPMIVEGAGQRFITLTDPTGRYSMFNLPDGDYSAYPIGQPEDAVNFKIQTPSIIQRLFRQEQPLNEIETLRLEGSPEK